MLDLTCTVCSCILHPAAQLYFIFPYLHFPSLHICTCFFRTCIFHPCTFVLDFSVLAFSYAPSRRAIFSDYAGYFFGNFRDKANFFYYTATRILSSAFQWSQNAWPWMTLNGYFAFFLFSCRFVWLPIVRLSKIIAWILIKIDTYCQQRKYSVATAVSDVIKFVRIFARDL